MNRIVGRRIAVVEEHPGVTRDRKSVEAEWTGVAFDLVDTAARWPAATHWTTRRPSRQSAALAEADLILCVVDVLWGHRR